MDAGIGSDPARNGTGSGAAARGFTLIELLVAISVLAVLAVGVSLSLGPGRGMAGRGDAAAFATAWDRTATQAITGRAARGLVVTPQGFAPVTRGPEGWLPPGPLRRWQGRAVLSAPPSASPDAPSLVFLPNGHSSPFTLTLRPRNGAEVTRCDSDGWTGLRCDG
jgi:prepilin-type N-terminal cleavage/methylation domain-containing protein